MGICLIGGSLANKHKVHRSNLVYSVFLKNKLTKRMVLDTRKHSGYKEKTLAVSKYGYVIIYLSCGGPIALTEVKKQY